jgi:hypothetical protein
MDRAAERHAPITRGQPVAAVLRHRVIADILPRPTSQRQSLRAAPRRERGRVGRRPRGQNALALCGRPAITVGARIGRPSDFCQRLLDNGSRPPTTTVTGTVTVRSSRSPSDCRSARATRRGPTRTHSGTSRTPRVSLSRGRSSSQRRGHSRRCDNAGSKTGPLQQQRPDPVRSLRRQMRTELGTHRLADDQHVGQPAQLEPLVSPALGRGASPGDRYPVLISAVSRSASCSTLCLNRCCCEPPSILMPLFTW